MKKIISLGNIGNSNFNQVYKVLDKKGISSTLLAGMSHGNNMPYIIMKVKINKRGN